MWFESNFTTPAVEPGEGQMGNVGISEQLSETDPV